MSSLSFFQGWRKIPRPLSTGVHGIRPNYVIHFDYLFMGLGQEDMKYVLVIMDDVSFYTWLCPSPTADAEHTASELTRWIRTFTLLNTWVSTKDHILKKSSSNFYLMISISTTISRLLIARGLIALLRMLCNTFWGAAKPYRLNLSLPLRIDLSL